MKHLFIFFLHHSTDTLVGIRYISVVYAVSKDTLDTFSQEKEKKVETIIVVFFHNEVPRLTGHRSQILTYPSSYLYIHVMYYTYLLLTLTNVLETLFLIKHTARNQMIPKILSTLIPLRIQIKSEILTLSVIVNI